MVFCPKCRALMYPKEGSLVCKKCGYKKKKEGSNIVVNKQEKKDVTIVDGKEESVLPKTRVNCPKCGNNEAFWVLRQMRGSDEPESRFYTCTKCSHRWRED